MFTFACLVLLALWAARGLAATFIVVNTTNDNVANDGLCTLREAITAANNDTASGAASGECAAGSGADTITFAIPNTDAGCPSGVCTINLLTAPAPDTASALAISSDLTITGTGADKLIVKRGDSVAERFRIFSITGGAVAISGMTISNGRLFGPRKGSE